MKSQETKAKKRPRMIESSDEDDEDEQKKQKKAEPKAAMNASAKSQISSRQPSAQSTPQHLQSKSTTKQAKNNVKVTTTTKMAATGKPERKVEQPVVTNEKETHRKKAGEAENAKERGTQQEKRVKKERELKEKQRGTERAKEENTTKASVKELETDPAEMKEENLKAKDEEKDKRVEVTPHTTPKKEMDKVQERKERHARQLQEKQQRDKERQAKADALKADRQERAELKTGTDKKAKADDEDTAMEVDALPTPHKAKPKADPPKHPTATATKKEIPSFKKHKSTTNSPSTSGNATPNHFNLNDLFKLSESGVDVKASQAAKREKEEKARGEDREMRRRKEDYMRQLDHMLVCGDCMSVCTLTLHRKIVQCIVSWTIER